MFNPDEDQMSPLEERMRSWVPSPGGLDRDRMLFEAGRAKVQGTIQAGTRANLWKFATAAAVLLASGLGMAWHYERSQRRALELTVARLAPPPPAPFVSTPELMTERREKEAAVDPTSYLALVRQVNRLEDAANFEPHRTAPEAVPKIRAADPPRAAPLRPRDWDRVISLVCRAEAGADRNPNAGLQLHEAVGALAVRQGPG